MRHAMIMAGGSGTRLWPMSRKAAPKQLLPMMGGKSLLEIAAGRLDGLVEPSRRLICTGEKYRSAIRERMPGFADAQILGEPEGRDTVNAVGFTAAVLEKQDPSAVFAVLTADHLIEPVAEFRRTMEIGFGLVEEDARRMVTFGITPSYPATGFGYVERGEALPGHEWAFQAVRFVEKPEVLTATEYLRAGTFGWNSGMFVFSAKGIMDTLKRYMPETHAGLKKIADAWGTAKQRDALNEVYPKLKKISVDYAIMEPASKDPMLQVCMIPMNVQWMDVGSFLSYGETLTPDTAGNRSNGKSVLMDCWNVLTVSDDPGHTITALECKDLIVVHTKDATLVCPRSSAERIKELAGKVDAKLQ